MRPRRLDAVDAVARAPTRLVRESRPFRDGVVPTQDWKSRPIPTLQGTGILTEELEESIMQMQTFLTMRHVAPFREEATELLANLNDAADTLEQWVKVQLMWCSLESVFTGGDIAKQLPMEAKKFSKVDKDWTKIMRGLGVFYGAFTLLLGLVSNTR